MKTASSFVINLDATERTKVARAFTVLKSFTGFIIFRSKFLVKGTIITFFVLLLIQLQILVLC